MRPETLKDFIGNDKAVEKIKLKISSSAKNSKPFPHLGLFGPSGIGKSTLARVISNEINGGYVYINATVIKNPLMFRQQIAEAAEHAATKGSAIVMIDECHCLPRRIQDNLLSLLEDPAILCTAGMRYDERKRKLVKDDQSILKEDLPEGVSFCLATTHPGNLTDALMNRLFRVELQEYSIDELAEIARRSLKGLETKHATNVAEAARCARDVKKICENIYDIQSVEATNITGKMIERAINYSGYEKFGLTQNELRYIEYLGEVDTSSLANIASYLNISEKEVKEKIEPFLIRKKIMFKETTGRKLTDKGYRLYEKLKEK